MCWSWAYFLLLSDPCIHTRSFSEVWKSAVDHRSSLLSVFLLLTLRLNVISVNGYHLLNATKEGSGCWCGSMFASGRERLDTWEAGFWSWRYFPCSVAFGNWLCESFVVVQLVFRFVVSPPSQLSGKTRWNFTNGVLLLPIYRFIFFLLIICGEKTWVLCSVAKRYSKNKQELRVIVEKVELKASPQHGKRKLMEICDWNPK